MNDKAVYRTAPATPGLLKTTQMSYIESPYDFTAECVFEQRATFSEK